MTASSATASFESNIENKVTRWQGGQQTLDGPMRTLFEGKPIPHIWTGKLSTKLVWTVPKE